MLTVWEVCEKDVNGFLVFAFIKIIWDCFNLYIVVENTTHIVPLRETFIMVHRYIILESGYEGKISSWTNELIVVLAGMVVN